MRKRSNSNSSGPTHEIVSDDLNTVTFDLVLPKNLDECSESCREDYAYAVSVFFSGLPWHRVCQADHRDNNVNGRTWRAVLDIVILRIDERFD